MAEGTTAIDLALTTEGDADGTDLITFEQGTFVHAAGPPEGALQYIGNHEEIAARKLAPPFWGKPFVAALLAAFTRELQFLEDTFWEILESRTLANADLVRLKVLGKIVGQPRLGFDIETYRILIGARAIANNSRGRASDLIAVLDALGFGGGYTLTALGGAQLQISAPGPVTAEQVLAARLILPDTRSAGVGLDLLYGSDGDVGYWGTAIWGTSTFGGVANT
jgi:hypothetical protein